MRVFVEFIVDLRIPLMVEEVFLAREVLMKRFSMHLQIIFGRFEAAKLQRSAYLYIHMFCMQVCVSVCVCVWLGLCATVRVIIIYRC